VLAAEAPPLDEPADCEPVDVVLGVAGVVVELDELVEPPSPVLPVDVESLLAVVLSDLVDLDAELESVL